MKTAAKRFGNISSVGEQNRLRVLDLLRRHGKLSRHQLANETGLDRSTLSKMIGELIKQGLIQETGKAESTGVGKKQVLLKIVEESGAVLGIHCGGEQLNFCLIGLNGKVKIQKTMSVKKFGNVEKCITTFMTEFKDELTSLKGVGVAIPGIIDNDKGQVLSSRWEIADADELQKQFKIPIIYENAANAAALSEAFSSTELSKESIIFLNITFTPIAEIHSLVFGTGLIINGELFTGKGYGAGELYGALNPCGELKAISDESLQILASEGAGLNTELELMTTNIAESLTLLNAFMPANQIVIGGNRLIKNHKFFESISTGINKKSGLSGEKRIILRPCRFDKSAPAIGAGLSLINQLSLKEFINTPKP